MDESDSKLPDNNLVFIVNMVYMITPLDGPFQSTSFYLSSLSVSTGEFYPFPFAPEALQRYCREPALKPRQNRRSLS
jgi:hypothetical protein